MQNEFGGTAPIGINEYYRNAGLTTSNNAGIPTTGLITIQQFYGATKYTPGSVAYTTSGSFVTPPGATTLNVTLTAGGGGGGSGWWMAGGGGGAGQTQSFSVATTAGTTYPYTVGAGGIAGVAINNHGVSGGNGGNSTFGAYTSIGGFGGLLGAQSGTGWGAGGAYGGGGSNPHLYIPGDPNGYGYNAFLQVHGVAKIAGGASFDYTWTITVTVAGTYTITGSADSAAIIYIDGVSRLSIPNTSYSNGQVTSTVALTVGTHTIRLYEAVSAFGAAQLACTLTGPAALFDTISLKNGIVFGAGKGGQALTGYGQRNNGGSNGTAYGLGGGGGYDDFGSTGNENGLAGGTGYILISW